jgi:hypothetical protein
MITDEAAVTAHKRPSPAAAQAQQLPRRQAQIVRHLFVGEKRAALSGKCCSPNFGFKFQSPNDSLVHVSRTLSSDAGHIACVVAAQMTQSALAGQGQKRRCPFSTPPLPCFRANVETDASKAFGPVLSDEASGHQSAGFQMTAKASSSSWPAARPRLA